MQLNTYQRKSINENYSTYLLLSGMYFSETTTNQGILFDIQVGLPEMLKYEQARTCERSEQDVPMTNYPSKMAGSKLESKARKINI